VSRRLPSQAVCELFDLLEDVVFWIKDRGGRYQWVNVTNFLNLGLSRREIAKAPAGMPTARAMAWAEDQVKRALQGRLETKGR